MSNSNTIILGEWSSRSEKLLEKAKKTYEELGIPVNKLPDKVFSGDKPISLVFAGQYNAGKSTILKALTGIKTIETGDGIVTQEAHSYEWNGMEVVDTPGIGTQVHPEHDAISFKAIAEADLLVYIVTHNLFDDLIGEDFRKLIIANDKAKETILIVNKMADVGNTEENRIVKANDLKKVTDPYSPEELRTCFVDVESYLDSESEEDKEIADELRERSNYSALISTINGFVEDKALTVRLTTPLYRIIDSIQEEIVHFLPSTGDSDIDDFEETQLRQKSIFTKAMRSIEEGIKEKYRFAASEIRELGRSLANDIDTFSTQSEADDAVKSAEQKVNTISEKCSKDVETVIEDSLSEYEGEMDEFYNDTYTQKVYERIEKKNYRDMPFLKKIVDQELLQRGGATIVQNAGGTSVGLKGLGGLKGTNVHQLVLDVGHFFGHSFKPWEAIKITKGINIAGKVLGVVGTILSIGMQAKEDYDAEQRVKEQRDAREQIRAAYNMAAESLESHFETTLKKFLKEKMQPRLNEINENISEIQQLRASKSEKCNNLLALDTECRKLISDIHAEIEE